jgi:hypothetical protein
MTLPGFTAEAAIHNQATVVYRSLRLNGNSSTAAVTVAARPTLGYRYCGECALGAKECPNPNGFGCNVCVPVGENCPVN